MRLKFLSASGQNGVPDFRAMVLLVTDSRLAGIPFKG